MLKFKSNYLAKRRERERERARVRKRDRAQTSCNMLSPVLCRLSFHFLSLRSRHALILGSEI